MLLHLKRIALLTTLNLLLFTSFSYSQQTEVIAYFSGNAEQAKKINVGQLTQIIYSFCHLKGNQLTVDSKASERTIETLVTLKKKKPGLKIVLSLGGWGGCETCSPVFSTEQGRNEFATSVRKLSEKYHTDGIDLDWEYPAIEGYPQHAFVPEDREHFTQLIQALRKELGNREISFAAGGFKKFLDESIDWAAVMPLVNRVNLMTYDLVNGYSTTTGHHTPLYSATGQPESIDFCVKYLEKLGVPKNKLVIGAAFYARVWENVKDENHGLFQNGKFKQSVDYRNFSNELSEKQGFTYYWDATCQAPYRYNAAKQLFATFDDPKSIQLKTEYVLKEGLQGIMFWELTLDADHHGLLSEIEDTATRFRKK
jgi:chitinase